MFEKCLICETSINPYQWAASGTQPIEFSVGANYRITEKAAMNVLQNGLKNRHLYSGAVRELSEGGRDVIIEDFDAVFDSVDVPDNPVEI